MRCYCCGNDYPVDQFSVYVGGVWVPIGISRACIEYAKLVAKQRGRRKGRARLLARNESKQTRYAA